MNKIQSEKNNLELYMDEVGEYKPITKEEEKRLGKLYKENNDIESRNKLISNNTKLVAKFARELHRPGYDYLDLIQEGNIGLMKAVEKYDYKYDNSFATYASYWIKNYIMTYINTNKNQIKIPKDKSLLLSKVKKAIVDYTNKYTKRPNIKELIKYLYENKILDYLYEDIDYSDEEKLDKYYDLVNFILPKDFEIYHLDIDKKFKCNNQASIALINSNLGYDYVQENEDEEWLHISDLLEDKINATPEKTSEEHNKFEVINEIIENLPYSKRHKQLFRLYYGLNNEKEKSIDEICEIFQIKDKEKLEQKIESIELKVINNKEELNNIKYGKKDSSLTDYEQVLFALKYGIKIMEPKTLYELADIFNISHQAIHQTNNKILSRMKTNPKILRKLKDFY